MKRFLLIAIAVAACSKSKDEAKPKDKAPEPAAVAPKAVEQPKVEAPPLPALAGMFACKAKDPNGKMALAAKGADPWQMPFTVGGCPAVPPVYGTAAHGMPAVEAGKASKAKVDDSGTGYIYIGKHPIRYQFAFHSDDNKQLHYFSFNVDENGFAQMKDAWGEPVKYKALLSEGFAWFNPAAKIKVTAEPDKWSRTDPKTKDYVDVPGYRVRIVRYAPLADVLGPDGIVQKPLLGKSAEEINTLLPRALEVKSAAQNKADLDQLGLDEKTKKGVEAMGVGGASANLKLPETETGLHHMLVQPDWKDGKITRYSFTLPFGKGNDAVKNEILAQIVKSLGAPEIKQDEIRKELWVYSFKSAPGSKVELRGDILGDAWVLEVESGK